MWVGGGRPVDVGEGDEQRSRAVPRGVRGERTAAARVGRLGDGFFFFFFFLFFSLFFVLPCVARRRALSGFALGVLRFCCACSRWLCSALSLRCGRVSRFVCVSAPWCASLLSLPLPAPLLACFPSLPFSPPPFYPLLSLSPPFLPSPPSSPSLSSPSLSPPPPPRGSTSK